jgi:MoxR-like ATPase
LSGEHILLEDVPGVGKTLVGKALARSLSGDFCRLQFTPDLLPSDIIGSNVFNSNTSEFVFHSGPIFSNIVIADEINRSSPRTQSALLEAMSDQQVSVDGETHNLPQPFMVVATQNPYEFEGTYFLPENQLDRFLMRINLGYPAPDDESRIINRQPARTTLVSLEPVMDAEQVVALQERVDQVKMDQALVDYVIALSSATRENEDLQIGLSTRGALAIAQAAKATAVLHNRDYCVPEDIVSNVIPVCSHRVISKTYMHAGDAATTRRIIQQVLETVPSPA